MSQPQLTPQQEALAQELADAIHQGTDDLITQIARTLAGAVADSFGKGAELLQEMAGARLSESTVGRTAVDAGSRTVSAMSRLPAATAMTGTLRRPIFWCTKRVAC